MGHFSEFPDTCSFAQEWAIDKMGHSEPPSAYGTLVIVSQSSVILIEINYIKVIFYTNIENEKFGEQFLLLAKVASSLLTRSLTAFQ